MESFARAMPLMGFAGGLMIGLAAALMLFGDGLALSGMVDPSRVRAFLDVMGDWDPTLAFVMGGAFIPMALAWRVTRRLDHPLAAPALDVPDARRLDARLVTGSALFGIAGLCPGPAIAGLVLNPAQAALFVAAMLGGMGLHRTTLGRPQNRSQLPNPISTHNRSLI